MGERAHERFLCEIGHVGLAAEARSDKIRNAPFITIDEHGKTLAFAAQNEPDQLLVGLLFDRHPPPFLSCGATTPGSAKSYEPGSAKSYEPGSSKSYEPGMGGSDARGIPVACDSS